MDDQITREALTMNTEIDSSKRGKLTQAIEETYDDLLKGIRVLIWKMGMAATPNEVDDLSKEILNETVLTAIEIDERYNPEKSIHAWLMGIAANKIKGMRTKEYRRGKRMGNAAETYQNTQKKFKHAREGNKVSEQITEDEMIDYLNTHNTQNNPLDHKIRISFAELISLVSPEDQHMLKLAFVYNLRGNDLAATLRISDGAANVRLSRAITRLRQAYLTSEAS